LIGGVIVLAVVAAACAGFFIGRSSSQPQTQASSKHVPAHHKRPLTVTPTAPSSSISTATAPQVSASIAIEQSDLPNGFVSSGMTTYSSPASSSLPPSACTPISGKPWVGYTTSSFGSQSENEGVTASIWVMPDAQIAQSSVAAVLVPTFGPGCLEPSFDAYVRRNAVGLGEPASCGALIFSGSTIARVASPVVGWRYSGTVHCQMSADPYSSTSYRDTIFATHGPIVMEIDFTSSSPPVPLEVHLLETMELRAAQYSTGPILGQTP
jgi:hypothetical protein